MQFNAEKMNRNANVPWMRSGSYFAYALKVHHFVGSLELSGHLDFTSRKLIFYSRSKTKAPNTLLPGFTPTFPKRN